MSGKEKTPGQRAYEAAREPAAIGWQTLPPEGRARWEAAAQAAIAEAVDPTAQDYDNAAEIIKLRDQLAAVTAERDQLKARLEDGGAEHPSCDAHRWWAVVKHYGSFAYGFAATHDGLRVWDDASEFEYAKARDFE